MKTGDIVIHTASGRKGVIVATEHQGGSSIRNVHGRNEPACYVCFFNSWEQDFNDKWRVCSPVFFCFCELKPAA